MILGSLLVGSPSGDALVVTANANVVYQQSTVGTVYAGVEFNTSGVEYENDGPGLTTFNVSRGNWLDAGASSAVWVERTLNDATTLNWLDPGAGRLQLNSTRQYGVSRSSDGTKTADVTFDFYDAASLGNLLDSVTIDITAERVV